MVKETSIKTKNKKKDNMWSLAWEPPLWKRKYMYTNGESIPYYFKYLEGMIL